MLVLQTWEFSAADNHWAAGWETGRIAWHLTEGNGFAHEIGPGYSLAPTALLAPLYPSFVALVFELFGAFSTAALCVVILTQIACSTLTAVFVARLGDALGKPTVGLVAAWALALAPSSINVSTRIIWCTSLLMLECVALALAFVRLEREPRVRPAIATGLLIGLLLLTSPAPALFVAFGAVWLSARHGRRVLPAVGAMTLTATIAVVPWIVRNHAVFDEWFFIKSNFNNELFIGNGPRATGDYLRVDELARTTLPAATYRELVQSNELQRSRILGTKARSWIAENPGRFAALTATRFVHFWRYRFVERWDELPLGPLARPVAFVYGFAHDALLVLALIGLVAALRSSRNAWLPAGFLLCYPLVYYLTHVDISRYRAPVVPFVLLFAAWGLAALAARKAAL